MKNRNIALCIILTLVTCGIYSLFWNVNLNNDFAEHNGKEKWMDDDTLVYNHMWNS